MLRPINVPVKNKWLRDVALEFHTIDNLKMAT